MLGQYICNCVKLTINDQSFQKCPKFLDTTLFLLNFVFTTRRLLLSCLKIYQQLTVCTERYVDRNSSYLTNLWIFLWSAKTIANFCVRINPNITNIPNNPIQDGEKKNAPYQFSPVTSTNKRISPQNFLTFNFKPEKAHPE